MRAIDLGLFQSPPLLAGLHNIATVVHAFRTAHLFKIFLVQDLTNAAVRMGPSLTGGFEQRYRVARR